MHCVQVPGFTHPVQDFYLEDVLALLQEPRSSGGASGSGRGRGQGRRGGGGAGRRALGGDTANGGGRNGGAVGPDRRAAMEAAILQAFMGGSDADFDHLLEVSPGVANVAHMGWCETAS